MVRDPSRRRLPLPDRLIEVIDDRQTGETILDEALKMIKTTEEKMGVGSWIDLMSGIPSIPSVAHQFVPHHMSCKVKHGMSLK